jgi:uncharacterized protein involved in outer membrane biogenesis
MTSGRSESRVQRLQMLLTGVPVLVTVAVALVLVVAYTLVGFFLVPRLVTRYVPRYVQEQLGRRAEIGEVRWNPFLFTLDIKHFRLQEADGRPLLGFDRLLVDFEFASLLRAAWTFAEIQLEAPRLDLVMAPDGRLNLADLLDTLPTREPAAQPTAPPRVLLRHMVVRDGRASFTDLSGRAPQAETVAPINIELHDITTVPDRRGPYTISATLSGGGEVGWDGEVSLVPLGSTGRLGLRSFPLATAWRFVQEDVAVAEPAGQLDATVSYHFAYRDGVTSLTVEGTEVAVKDLLLTQRGDKAPLVALEKIQLTAGRGDLIARQLTVAEVSASRGRVAATMAPDGTVNWQNLMVTRPTAAVTPAAASDTPSWRLTVEKARVEEVALTFVDQSRASPLGVDVAGLTLSLSARLESGPAGLAGTAEDLGLALGRIALREAGGAGTPLVSLEQVSVDGGRIDLGGRQVTLSKIAVKGGATRVIREVDGSLPLVRMLEPVGQGGPAPGAAGAPAAGKPWTFAVGRVDLADHRVAITDRGVTPAVELGIEQLAASVRDVRSDSTKPFPFDTSFRLAQGGRFTAKGRVAPDGRTVDATLTVAQLALTPAQPYVATTAAVVLRSGDVSTTGRLTYRSGRERAAVTYVGSADVDGVLVVEAASGDPVLAWKSLHADTLRFGLAPDRLEIAEVRLAGLDGKFVIFQDKTINIAKLMAPPPEAPAASPGPSGPATTPAATTGPGFPVVIERVRLDDSSMNFADLSLVLPFATRVHALQGVVVGLGSDPTSRATVKLDGRVDEFGSVKVDGALSPLYPKVFADLGVIFRNVPMPTLSPYSATFAGRRIVAGAMDLDLRYKIDQSNLVGENKVVLQKLQLGERVESPGATRLPLDLAIAILSDSEGRIDITLPVRGNVDSPEFSYGHLIWQALVTLIQKVVTSPFRALGALFGGDAESVEAIAFEPGSDTVLPPEREKLKRVAQVLGKRPRLKLTVHGGYETKADGEALRSLRVRQELAQRLDLKLKPGEDPGPVAFDQAKTQRALEALLTERGGSKAIDEREADYQKRTGKKPERANPMLALVGRGSSDRAFYEALFRRLVEMAPLTDAELAALAKRRGEATARALSEGAGAAAARVEVGDAESVRAERNAIPTRLELGAAGS